MALEKMIGMNPHLVYYSDSDEVREKFVKGVGDLFDVEEYYEKLRENNGDIDALRDFIGVAIGYLQEEHRKDAEEDMMANPHKALNLADHFLRHGYVNLAKFVENNRDAIFDRLSAEQLYSLFSKVPLYTTGDREHDDIASLRQKVMQMQQASQKGEDLGSVIQKEMKELIKMIPEEQRAFFQSNSGASSSLASSLIGEIQKSYWALFKLPDGKLDKQAIRKYLEDNYEVIEDLKDDSGKSSSERLSKREKEERWDKNLKMQYVEVARVLFKSEKPIYKRDKDEDKENRKDRDKKRGIAT